MSFMKSQLRLNFSNIKSYYRSLHLEKYKDIGIYKVANSKSNNFESTEFNINTDIFKRSIFPNSQTNVEVSSNFLRKQIPNDAARGIKKLDRSLFTYPVKVLGIKVPNNEVYKFTCDFYKCLASCPNFKPVATLNESDSNYDTHKLVLIESSNYKTTVEFTSEYAEELAKLSVDGNSCHFYDVTLNYENWDRDEILKCILPDKSDIPWFGQIGHIAHLNLTDDLIEYKHVIGEVILDQINSVKTVVNKLSTLGNTFRNFEMELLAGEDNFVTVDKGHGYSFELDFSKIYWNSSLSTEHKRIFRHGCAGYKIFDVFAGVGPFSIPFAKRASKVFANDPNPHSVYWLNKNVELNKIQDGKIEVFNMDGLDFVKNVVRPELLRLLISKLEPNFKFDDLYWLHDDVHILMNLPASDVEFLDVFHGLLSEESVSEITSSDCNKERSVIEGSDTKVETANESNKIDAALASAILQRIFASDTKSSFISIHCQISIPMEANPEADVIETIETILGVTILTFVRATNFRVVDVGPNEKMVCFSVSLPWKLLLRKQVE